MFDHSFYLFHNLLYILIEGVSVSGDGRKVLELTFQDVPTLQLLHIRSLAQPPAEKHQNHVLNHCDFSWPCPVLFKPAVVSSLCAFSRGIPYVSISHPNRGCGASAEALPTSGTVEEARFCRLRILHQIISRCQDAASQVQLPCNVDCTRPRQLRHYSTIRHSLQALFNWVVMGCWGATPLVSLVTACIICRRRSLTGSHSRHPQPPVVHWATGTLISPSLHQFSLFFVT